MLAALAAMAVAAALQITGCTATGAAPQAAVTR